MNKPPAHAHSEAVSSTSNRLHYLDWLGVIAVLGVFLFHAVHPFDVIDWHIKNEQQSELLSLIMLFFVAWGMPFFFLLAGAGSQFALRRRTGRQFVFERVTRLLIPFVVGSVILSPIMIYLEQLHKEKFFGSFFAYLPEFFGTRRLSLSPRMAGDWGNHLWFLGFLFAFSLLALPLFLWLKGDSGRRFVEWLGRLGDKRGGILLFFVPLAILRLLLQPIYPDEHDWTDFLFLFLFFVFGHILYADGRFTGALSRDRKLIAVIAAVSAMVLIVAFALGGGEELIATPGTPKFIFAMCMWGLVGWTWTLFILAIGKRSLDYTSPRLQHWREAQLPFFVLHQPVIIFIAFYVVGWDAGLTPKLLIVVAGSFLVTIGLYEYLIRRVPLLRGLFGMKQTKRAGAAQPQVGIS